MFDIPLIVFIWMATILIHAMIHFGFISPRSNTCHEDDLEILTEEVNVIETSEDSEDYEDDQNKVNSNSVDAIKRKRCKKEEINSIEIAENDGTSASTSSTRPSRNMDGGENSPIHESAYGEDDDSIFLDNDSKERYGSSHNLSQSQHYQQYEEDEKWRFELLRDYYSSSYLNIDENNGNCYDDNKRDNCALHLRVIPTKEDDDIVYKNGRIHWSIKRKISEKNPQDQNRQVKQRTENLSNAIPKSRTKRRSYPNQKGSPSSKRSNQQVLFSLSDQHQLMDDEILPSHKLISQLKQ